MENTYKPNQGDKKGPGLPGQDKRGQGQQGHDKHGHGQQPNRQPGRYNPNQSGR